MKKLTYWNKIKIIINQFPVDCIRVFTNAKTYSFKISSFGSDFLKLFMIPKP